MTYSSQDVVKDEPEKEDTKKDVEPKIVATIQLKEVIGSDKWNHIQNTKAVNIYRVDSLLIDTHTNEYGRKLTKVDSLQTTHVSDFVKMVSESKNYPVAGNSKASFNPTTLFEFCAETCDLSVLFDKKNYKIGFINRSGQEVVNASEELAAFLKLQLTN
ncbi:hypothetical protein GCM10008083_19430 [Ulvibacter litoralis]|nr:hypothetical protein GCM10008083_19430 [Ulvibacter litoralis]